MKSFFKNKKSVTTKTTEIEKLTAKTNDDLSAVITVKKSDHPLLILGELAKIKTNNQLINIIDTRNIEHQDQIDNSKIVYQSYNYSSNFKDSIDENEISIIYGKSILSIEFKYEIPQTLDWEDDLELTNKILKLFQTIQVSAQKFNINTKLYGRTPNINVLELTGTYKEIITLKHYMIDVFFDNKDILNIFTSNVLNFIPNSINDLPDAKDYNTLMELMGFVNSVPTISNGMQIPFSSVQIENINKENWNYEKYFFFIIDMETSQYIANLFGGESDEFNILSITDNRFLLVIDIHCFTIMNVLGLAYENDCNVNTNIKTAIQNIVNIYKMVKDILDSEIVESESSYNYINNNSNQNLSGENSFIQGVDEIIE